MVVVEAGSTKVVHPVKVETRLELVSGSRL